MPAERFFSDNELKINHKVELTEQEFHHLVNVMRAQEGDKVEIVNGRGSLAEATVTAREKKRALLHIDHVAIESPPEIEIILAQATPRINRLDFILEKGTELGMTQLWLFPGRLSERQQLTEHQLERMRGITIAAMKQCGRVYLPSIHIKPPIAQWTTLPEHSYFGDVDSSAQEFSQLWRKPKQAVLLCIGPEAGFSADEVETLRNLNVQGVKFHNNILRTDTASLMALSLVSHWLL